MDTLPPDVTFDVFADYNTVLVLADGALPPAAGGGTVEEMFADHIAARPGLLCVGTARGARVPLTIHVTDAAPRDDLAVWDHVTQTEITTTTGRLRVMGVTDDEPQAHHVHLPPGSYHARVYSGGLDTVSADGLDGEDHYRITLWPKILMPPEVVKRYRGPYRRS